jgi:glucokinase
MAQRVPTTTSLEARSPLFVGIDLGGTNIKFGIVDSSGRTVAFDSIRTASQRGVEDAVSRMADKVHAMLAAAQIAHDVVGSIGLATPGTMDIPAGMMLEPPNLPWRNFPIRDALARAAGMEVVYENDATAAAFGEYWVGGGAAFSSIVFLTLGTGVGSGIIIHGVPLEGNHSHGGECGHIIIDSSPEARMCGCGQRGHLEAYCSATALVKRAQELLDAGRQSSIAARVAAGEALTGLMISEEASQRDGLAVELVMELAEHLGRGMVTIAHTIDPEAMILGGAMNFGGEDGPAGQEFLAQVTATFQSLAFPTLAENTKIAFAQLGSAAGYIGAAGVARRQQLQRSST